MPFLSIYKKIKTVTYINKNAWVTVVFLCLQLSSPSVPAAINAAIGIETYLAGTHTQSDTITRSRTGSYCEGGVQVRPILRPLFTYEEDFQCDASIDGIVFKSYAAHAPFIVRVKELYVDCLFYSITGIKTGYCIVDYGFCGYFQPLSIIDFAPSLGDLYRQITFGNSRSGYFGVPAVRIKQAMPEIISGFTSSLTQTVVLRNFDRMRKNYFITQASIAGGGGALNMMLGYSLHENPSVGTSLKYVLPKEIVLCIEGLYKKISMRPVVEHGVVIEKRSGRFINTSISVALESFIDPLFKNQASAAVEYFYYGEGIGHRGIDAILTHCATDPSPTALRSDRLIVPDRNFKHNLFWEAGYHIRKLNLDLQYRDIASIEPVTLVHTICLSKTYPTATLSVAYKYADYDPKYAPLFSAVDWQVFFTVASNL